MHATPCAARYRSRTAPAPAVAFGETSLVCTSSCIISLPRCGSGSAPGISELDCVFLNLRVLRKGCLGFMQFNSRICEWVKRLTSWRLKERKKRKKWRPSLLTLSTNTSFLRVQSPGCLAQRKTHESELRDSHCLFFFPHIKKLSLHRYWYHMSRRFLLPR